MSSEHELIKRVKVRSENYIFVTGCAGFIGFNLCRKLLDMGCKVIGADNFNSFYPVILKEVRTEILLKYKNFKLCRSSIEDYENLSKLFRTEKIELVCNLAAQAGVRHSIEHPFDYEKSNISGFLSILELCRHNNIKRLVYASSSSVYGGNTKIPFSESDNVDRPISLYAATKKADELMAHSYSHLYSMQTVGLRFFSAYGPWGRPDMALWLFTEAIINGEPIKIFNHGKMKRDFTYIDDITEGIIAALFSEKLERYEILNLGNNHSEDLFDMIGIIEDELKLKSRQVMLPMQSGDIPESFADISLASEKLGYSPKTRISKGIPAFIQWYHLHPEMVQKIAAMRKNREF